jgi:hypothetical protein
MDQGRLDSSGTSDWLGYSITGLHFAQRLIQLQAQDLNSRAIFVEHRSPGRLVSEDTS